MKITTNKVTNCVLTPNKLVLGKTYITCNIDGTVSDDDGIYMPVANGTDGRILVLMVHQDKVVDPALLNGSYFREVGAELIVQIK